MGVLVYFAISRDRLHDALLASLSQPATDEQHDQDPTGSRTNHDALHQPSLRPTVEEDFARLPEWIEKAGDVPEYVELPVDDSDDNKPEQLSLF